MVTIKTTDKAVNLNGIFTDNKGAFTYVISGDIITIRPKNLSSKYAGRYSEFNCDNQTFNSVSALQTWLEENLFYKGGGSGEGLQKATSAEVIEGTNDSKYVTPQAAHDAISAAMEGDMAAYVNVLGDNFSFGQSGFYTFNGSQPSTKPLPAVASNGGVHYFLKNIGTANLTITGTIYLTSLVTEATLLPGDAIIIQNNTTNWTIQ